MRITNSMIVNSSIADMNKNLERMQKVQQQMTSGLKYQKASDNPTEVTKAIQLNTSLTSLAQYKTNISTTSSFLDATDTALGQAGEALQNIRLQLVSAGVAGVSSSDLVAIKNTVNQDIAQFADILNTKFGGKYVFGGTSGDAQPVKAVTSSVVDSIVQTNPNAPALTTIGTPTGLLVTSIKVMVSATNTPIVPTNATSVKISLDGGTTYGANVTVDNKGDFTIQGGLSGNINNSASSVAGDTYIINCSPSGNTKLVYCDTSGAAVYTPSTSLSSKMKVSIAEGVTVDYSAGVTDIMSTTGSSTGDFDIRKVFSDIVNNLDGNVADPITGVLSPNSITATTNIAGSDLSNIDTVIAKLLAVRAQVGSVSNRMTNALNQNDAQKENVTDLLTKTEGTDITQATIEFASLQSVFLASIQASAKIIQPTLMDYLK